MRYKYAPKWHNVHHKLPRSRWWNHEKDNLVNLKIKRHDALHNIFWNDTTAEKIARVLQMDIDVLQWDFVNDIMNILELYWNDTYHKHVTK